VRCLVTAGPTWEPLDRVRRLTNFSTGSLGGELANELARRGHDVTLFLSDTATWREPLGAVKVESFSTTDSLAASLELAAGNGDAVIFHAAAVSDFTGVAAFERTADGGLTPLKAGKLSTRSGSLLVELRPTPKILPRLREWFPRARIIGWKYEVDGDQAAAVAAGKRQLHEARNDACVINGAAYGRGFGLLRVGGQLRHLPDRAALFAALAELATEAVS
jgi:phosphopantothenoylcysteine synthetase/decarboxylase